ncbi:SUMF1/EgtB/PvdO family nonheme iron enzyme [bacterium]|nr:SUMF1/EgtB/PvdO family nonheme iron enzyme [bacterium]
MKINGPDAPEIVGSIDLPAYSRGITVRNGWALIAASDGGVHVIDVSDPENPIYSGTVEAGFALDLCVTDSGHVLVADRDDGLFVLGGLELAVDTTAPAKINTLQVESLSFTEVELNWLATGDDELNGRATSYQARYLEASIENDADWEAATPIENLPTPGLPGELETINLDLFTAGQTLNFCIRAVDDQGHMSPIGNSFEVTMPEGIFLTGAVDINLADENHLFVFEMTYINSHSRPPEGANLFLDYESYEMEYISGDYYTGALYRLSMQLTRGRHDYWFEFSDSDFFEQTANDVIYSINSFEMGSPLEEVGRNDDEILHTAGLRDLLVCAPYEVTQLEWTAMGMTNNSHFIGDNLPVENVTWNQAIEYCNLLSVADGYTPAYNGTDWDRNTDGWRLPTEAEWEYQCRADSEGSYNGENIDDLGWHDGNSGFTTHPVGEKLPNAWGLYDMHGNVREWCWDWYSEYEDGVMLDPTGPATGVQKVVRGGSWHYFARECRSAARGVYYPSSADDFIGFRVVRSVQ